ncbi:MAG: non-homologous end-joining DNA ligase [Terriglobales bacterium]
MKSAAAPSLRDYQRKRRFAATPEPDPGRPKLAIVPPPVHARRRFCVQQHHASRLHYDFRLEIGEVLKSWAIPKGPSLDPEVKRLAMATEDHPLDYLTFEGTIPQGNYGAGEVIVWDLGEYEALGEISPLRQWEQGHVKFRLHGKKLKGEFALTYMPPRPQPSSVRAAGTSKAPENTWLLIKKRDDAAQIGDSAENHPGSVLARHRRARAPAGLHLVARARKGRPLRPMLATLAAQPFRDPGWLFELKWDGIRALADCRAGRVRLLSRSGRELTRQYPELQELPAALTAVLDGEIVALDADGKPSFHRLQRRMNLSGAGEIARLSEQVPVVFYAFDLLSRDGADLTTRPLLERKAKLAALAWAGAWRYSDHVAGDGIGLYELARQRGLEGVVAKRADSPYEAGRSRLWLKFKLQQRQDVVIVGYTDPQGSRSSFGALLAAVYEPGERRLIYAGKIGTGFDSATRAQLLRRFTPVVRARVAGIEAAPRAFHAVAPEVVAEVKFAEWTPAGHLRAPVFLGARVDKRPEDCLREVPRA